MKAKRSPNVTVQVMVSRKELARLQRYVRRNSTRPFEKRLPVRERAGFLGVFLDDAINLFLSEGV